MPSKGFFKKTSHTAQVGLEYLITFGWVLVVITTIIGILVFTVNDGVNTESCAKFLKLICKGINADGDTLVMVLQNATGQKISIMPFEGICFDGECGYGKIEYQGKTYWFETVEIGAGEQFKVFGAGQALANQISITYTESVTGLEQTDNAPIRTGTQPGIEISNDGLQDPSGLTDCENPALIPCEYPVNVDKPTSADNLTAEVATPIVIEFSSTAISNLLDSGIDWDITSAYLYFNATSVSGTNVKAQIQTSKSTNDIVTGWNSVKIEGITTFLLDSPNLDLTASSGSFTIDGKGSANPPKMVITIQKYGGVE